MKHRKLWLILSSLGLLAVAAVVAFPCAQEPEGEPFRGDSYLTTIKDAQGNFASRSVITVNSDQTVSAVDSGQRGPDSYFGEQLGMWKPVGRQKIRGRTLDFTYLPGTPGITRADYVISLGPDRPTDEFASEYTR